MNCIRCILLTSLLFISGCGDSPLFGSGEITGWYSSLSTSSIVPDGDVNGDTIVDHSDALLAQRFTLGMSQPSSEQLARGDVYTDGQMDLSDQLLIQRLALGM